MAATDTTPAQSTGHFPLAGSATDGFSTATAASATCFCGTVQISFPTTAPGFRGAWVCNCTDCRKISASAFASNFTVLDTSLTHIRGESNLTRYAQNKTPNSGKTMTNYFCKTCGTLLYRRGEAFPGVSFCRIGTVDDFALHETLLKPKREIWVSKRMGWFGGVEGAEQVLMQSPEKPRV